MRIQEFKSVVIPFRRVRTTFWGNTWTLGPKGLLLEGCECTKRLEVKTKLYFLVLKISNGRCGSAMKIVAAPASITTLKLGLFAFILGGGGGGQLPF